MSSPGAGVNPSTNPFLAAAPAASAAPIVDLFDAPVGQPDPMMRTGQQNSVAPGKASDDLLQLGNPFADMFGSGPAAVPAAAPNQMWMGNGGATGV